MDKLLMSAKMAHARAKQKIAEGKMPSFLGISGMLALMHERIVQFHANTNDQPQTDHVLELAADALVALLVVLPDIEEETTTEEESMELPEDSPRSLDEIPDEPTEGLTRIGPNEQGN